ncbi:MAG TPA: hypothetical protein VGR70_09860 [Stellaceae bacterium]|nr:hypothetical protein [Stellaceae bacterium]
MPGEKTALALAIAEQTPELDDEDRQFGLFSEPASEAGRRRGCNRGPGRPPGARNRHTIRSVDMLLSRHRDPRAVLLEIAQANIHDLVAMYGGTALQMLQEKRLAAAAVLPYVASRMPIQVDLREQRVVYLSLVDGKLEQAMPSEDGIGLVARVLDSEEYQEVSCATPGEDPAQVEQDVDPIE